MGSLFVVSCFQSFAVADFDWIAFMIHDCFAPVALVIQELLQPNLSSELR